MLIGGETMEHVFKPIEAKRRPDDGGRHGRWIDG